MSLILTEPAGSQWKAFQASLTWRRWQPALRSLLAAFPIMLVVTIPAFGLSDEDELRGPADTDAYVPILSAATWPIPEPAPTPAPCATPGPDGSGFRAKC